MDYKDYMEQRRIKDEYRERCRWRNHTIQLGPTLPPKF